MKKIFLSFLLPVLSLSANDLAIYTSKTHTSFSTKDFSTVVPNYMVSKSIREMKPERLAAILEGGNAYLTFNECSDGNYTVNLHGRVRGGGPVTAGFLYWVTKCGLYGTAAAATGVAITATGGAVAAAVGAGTAGAAVGTVGGVATVMTGAAIEGAAMGGAMAIGGVGAAGTIITSAVAGAGAEMALVGGTTAAVTSVGGVAGAIAVVESASLGAFAFGMALPLP